MCTGNNGDLRYKLRSIKNEKSSYFFFILQDFWDLEVCFQDVSEAV